MNETRGGRGRREGKREREREERWEREGKRGGMVKESSISRVTYTEDRHTWDKESLVPLKKLPAVLAPTTSVLVLLLMYVFSIPHSLHVNRVTLKMTRSLRDVKPIRNNP